MTRKKIVTSKKNIKKGKEKRIYKTYKAYPLHHMLFYACLSVCRRDKITDYLMKEFMGIDTQDLPHYSKSELFELMIEQSQKKKALKTDKRITEFISFFKEKNYDWNGVRLHLQTYAFEHTHQLITNLAKNTDTIAEVVESAIETYICNVSEAHYSLILLAFKNNFNDYLVNDFQDINTIKDDNT